LVLFNRFYQPDIDAGRRELAMTLQYSDSSELLLRLRWLAILSGRIGASLAVSGGVHEPIDAVKAVLAGADAVQMVSALMKNGPARLARVIEEFDRWGNDHGYESITQMRGALNRERVADPASYERGNYQQVLRSAGRDASWIGH